MPIDVKDFEKEVLQRSFKVPVVVDFWAEWCAPCRVLGPILERLEQQSNEKWVLAKIDTMEHPTVAQQYGVRGIPNVKLFVDGEVTSEFVGALPEYQVRRWLGKVVPGKYRKLLRKAEELLLHGQIADSQQILEEVLTAEPNNVEAKVLLARAILFSDAQRAAKLVEDIDEPKHADSIEAIRTISRLQTLELNPESLPDGSVRSTYQGAIQALLGQDFEKALERFIDVIRNDRYYDDDGARKACVAIFKTLGEDHPITQKHRRDFSSALYV